MKTEVLKLTGKKDDIKKIKTAAQAVEQGKLVVFPTETVYGIACATKADAIKHLDKVKRRSSHKRYSLHIACTKDIEKYVPVIPLRAKKLMDKVWPGPLTAVFEVKKEYLKKIKKEIGEDAFNILYDNNTIGIRYPDNETAQKFLHYISCPVVAPSANLANQPPATSVKEVLDSLDGKIDILLAPPNNEDSVCRYKKSSTVVKITDDQLQILRSGAINDDLIKDLSTINILFVCTGNTCRSPMAEALCKKYISEKLQCNIDEIENFGYKVESAGVLACLDIPASQEVIDICRQKGIDMNSHRSRLLTPQMALNSDKIFVMGQSHQECISEICPESLVKCELLDDKGDISDPIGRGMDVYCRCAETIEKAVKKKMENL